MKICGLIISIFFIIWFFIVIVMLIFFIFCVIVILFVSKDWICYYRNSSIISYWWDYMGKVYYDYIIGDVFEWLMVLFLLGFMFIFFGEFRFVKMKIVVFRRL